MSALINSNNNYTGMRYGVASFARNTEERKPTIKPQKLKNITPSQKREN